jgi:hypothetical protein
MLTWLDRLSSRLVLGALAPVVLFLTGWWGTLAVLGDSPAIGPAALGGLALGLALDFTLLRPRLDSLFDLGPVALCGLAAFYSVMIYGFFMGLPVFNVLVGLVGGYVAGRSAVRHGLAPERAAREARITATVSTSVLALLCVATAWMALREPTIGSQLRGMLGLPFEVTMPMVYATIVCGGASLLAAEYGGTILAARRVGPRLQAC